MSSPRVSPNHSPPAASPVQSLRHLAQEEDLPEHPPPVIDPALADLRGNTSLAFSYQQPPYYLDRWHAPTFTPAVFHLGSHPSHHPRYTPYDMPHRVDSGDRNGQGRPDERAQYEHPGSHPSPPPIATLHSSPAPSAENSSLTSPSPPLSQPGYYQGSAQNGPGMHPGSYTYAPAPHARYPADPASAHQMQSHYPPSSHYQPQQSAQQPAYIVHTDDAATKLNDRVRRKCYNCRTTDTSTWRRSSLAPGKVLCNKCGLFERTHSRPRPEQFPHKRGPIVTTTFKSSRSPPPPQASRLPPIQQQMSLPPHHYDHPSIAPLLPRSDSQGSYASNGSNSLPEIRNLLNSPQQSGAAQQAASQQQPSSANGDANSLKRPHSPASPSARSPRADRSPPYMYRTNSVAATAAA